MKKIAIITPFLAQGGLEKVAIVGAEELSKDYDVTLIVMDSFRIDYPYSGKMIDMKLSLMDRGVSKRLYNVIASILKLRKLKKEHRFDLVISHGELANLPNVFSGGEKNILVIHGDRFAEAAVEDIQSRFVNRVIKYIYFAKNVSKVVTVSEGIRESFKKILGIKDQDIVTIHNPFDLDEIKALAQEPLKEYDSLFSGEVISTAGRLSMLKGQWYLLRIFRELKKEKRDLKLILLGDGEIREKLIDLSEELGLTTYSVWSDKKIDNQYDVYFLGFRENPFNFIHSSRLFIMTSLLEGFGNTIVESMACGTPVISTNCRFGPGEIMAPESNGNGRLSKPNNDGYGVLMPVFSNAFVGADEPLGNRERLWVDTLQNLLNNDEKLHRYSELGLERAEDFRLDSIMAEWKDLIDAIV